MTVTRISDVVVPAEFTEYQLAESMKRTALFRSGILVPNGVIRDQLNAGAESFTVPHWNDLDGTPNLTNDDPDDKAPPEKLTSGKIKVRKAFLHKSWSAMNLASQLAGSEPAERVQSRISAWWNRAHQARLIASLEGIAAANVAQNAGDMVEDISAETDGGEVFSAKAVIRAAGTLGDRMSDVAGIAIHSDTYQAALEADLIEFTEPSAGSLSMPTFRGLAVIVDDGMPADAGVYTSVLFATGTIGYGAAEPRSAPGTEIARVPDAGRGGGQDVLHSRIVSAIAPAGFSFTSHTVAGESPSLAELRLADNWERKLERKAVGLAFLKHKL